MPSKITLVVATVVLAGATAVSASPLPRATATFTAHPPVIDGVLSPGEWSEATPTFLPPEPNGHGTAQSSSGEIRLLWTKEGLYVGFKAHDSTPVFGHGKPGAPLHAEDVFEVFIDQRGDHLQYFEIQMDPAAQTFFKNYVLTAPPRLTPEKRFTPEFGDSELWRYDIPRPPGFRIASHFDYKTGTWTLEAFLPASFINRRRGGNPLEPETCRVNLVRYDWDKAPRFADRKSRFLYWAPVLWGCPHISPTAMGYLTLKKQ